MRGVEADSFFPFYTAHCTLYTYLYCKLHAAVNKYASFELASPTLLPLIRPRRASRHVCGSLETRDHAPPVNKRVLKCLTETVLVTSAGQTAPPSLSPSVLRTAHTTT